MNFLGLAVESLKIDKLKKRWAGRGIFLLVFLVMGLIGLFPPGDPDFSRLYAWVDKYGNNPTLLYSTATPDLPDITIGNVIFVLVSLFVFFVLIMLSFLYMRIYLGDWKGEKIASSISAYLRRGWIAAAFLLILGLILLTTSFFIYILIPVVLAFFFLTPAFILYDKRGLIRSTADSVLSSRGFRIPFLLSAFFLLLMYYSFDSICSFALGDYPEAGVLLNAFAIAYLVTAFGRLLGIYYQVIFNPLIAKDKDRTNPFI